MSEHGGRPLTLRASVLLLVATYAAAVGAVELAPADRPVAAWWPAAGIAVVLVACARPGRLAVPLTVAALVVVTAAANVTGGRPLDVATAFGAANAAEALVAGLVLRLGRGRAGGTPGLAGADDFVRLVLAALAGGATVAAGAALTVATLVPGGSPGEAAVSVLAAHAASTLVIAPIALAATTRRRPRGRSEELAVHVAALLVATLVVFSPAQSLPLAFVPFVLLAWAGLRFDLRTVTVELAGFAVLTTYVTDLGWGPLGNAADAAALGGLAAATLTQGYLVCAVLITLPLAIVVAQRADLLERIRSDGLLFRRNFTESLLGQVLLRAEGADLVVVDINDAAAAVLGAGRESLLGRDLGGLLVTPQSLPDLVVGLSTGRIRSWQSTVGVTGREGARVDVALGVIDRELDGGLVYSAQLLDVSREHSARRQLEAAQKLTSATLDTTDALILVTDLSGRVVRVNAATTRATGYGESELLGRLVGETGLAPDSGDLDALFVWPNRSGAPVVREGEALTRSGERRRIVWSSNVVRDEHGFPAFGVMTGIDVTTERASAGLVSHLMRAPIGTALLGLSPEGCIEVVNTGAVQLLGHQPHEVVGRRFVDLLDREQLLARTGTTDLRAAFAALVAEAGDGETRAREWTFVGGDGSPRVISVTLSATDPSLSTGVGYLCVGRDVTQQRRSQDMLAAALDKERTAVERLRALDEAKTEFVSTVSHELRTPITSIVGFTEMLQDGSVVEPLPEQLRLFETIARNGERLIALCNDLLMLSGLDSDDVTWRSEEVDLAACLGLVEDSVQPLLAGRDLTVTFETPTGPLHVLGDRPQLERVMVNLVSNAMKFTEDGGVVRARLSQEGDEAVLSVTDTGLGIPLDEQEDLFKRFFRSSTAHTEAIQGTGLGLAIVAAIVEAHGGRIRVRSAHLEGATFTVRLPLLHSGGPNRPVGDPGHRPVPA
ncbi:ATP-binding protein [Nocardioides sp. Leaf307]|uniref:ATP-binding protein n=1 Tax=Nocardioides sp. Leaf307 TaxID=1736331 RepID=UPI00071444E6|nr:ATP-binding protein [Nocardioides sp. Leaf307]KQQ43682.1 hypothetical protein ASF50_07195 [Nocardioides sp. Leaf307]